MSASNYSYGAGHRGQDGSWYSIAFLPTRPWWKFWEPRLYVAEVKVNDKVVRREESETWGQTAMLAMLWHSSEWR